MFVAAAISWMVSTKPWMRSELSSSRCTLIALRTTAWAIAVRLVSIPLTSASTSPV